MGEIEQATKVRVVVIPNPNMQTPHFEVIRLRDDEIDQDDRESFEIDLSEFDPSHPEDAEKPVGCASSARAWGDTRCTATRRRSRGSTTTDTRSG